MPKRVLIVDDDRATRGVLAAACAAIGAAVETCIDAAAAEAVLATARFDLILIDYHMPVTDGLTLARRLRAAGTTARLVCATADTLMAATEAMGGVCDAVLHKPISIGSIIVELAAA